MKRWRSGRGGSSYTYAYDPEGRRFAKTTGGVTTNFLYDREGHLRIITNFGPGEIYVAGLHLGTYEVNSAHTDSIFYYDHADWLGTERARTNVSGAACETIQGLPFGDGQVVHSPNGGCAPVADVSPMHFDGKERDSESGLDNFGARYNSSSMGRFMSPDPNQDSGFEHMDDPQSWNGYAYAHNNPESYIDPDGENYRICDVHGENCLDLGDEQYKEYQESVQRSNITINSAGQIQYTNPNGSVTNLGTASYYNEKDIQAAQFLVQTGKTLGDPRTIAGFYGASFLLGGCAIACPAAYTAAASTATGLLYTGLRAGMVIGGYVMTSHAAEEAIKDGVTEEEIEEAVSGVAKGNPNPERAWDSVQRFYTATCEVRVNKVTGTIVTVISKISR